ncbi:hypothetical protein ACZ11_00240 [Lysinibacillus xylanilyticus]|uniref:Uncharacterized protein n=1 Tax=Lysinibacillus xylanilyticus TaxID=582475 RepID=A0A0K9FH70_9BACI|nr:hypothetical protein [Lysinibacillus xylanilyticus]KMY33553.1 hypothetical protein ACZ11_00240 [Lysinibacillus xylanilyticus]
MATKVVNRTFLCESEVIENTHRGIFEWIFTTIYEVLVTLLSKYVHIVRIFSRVKRYMHDKITDNFIQ